MNVPYVRTSIPVLRDMNVPYSTRTPGHWMYLYERTNTPVLRDMGCTVPVLRDIGCIRTCVVVLPYSGT